MRNYIELNGVSSNTIQGLLIQELPPITKPKMRANIEEIDGKSGDIITELGYSAYDKPVQIGLYGDFDIDQVISYFNSLGQVVFSNEPDKYYNYTILDQIDFNKLIRFRTATVKFHCQPFKFSQENNSMTFNISEGITSINITNAGNIYSKPILIITGTDDLGIYLNGVQIFAISLGNLNQIIIDTNNMNAYIGTTFLNRIVIGDYNNFKLNQGDNQISWTGNISQITIENYSRWI